jgi:hypothetical protein
MTRRLVGLGVLLVVVALTGCKPAHRSKGDPSSDCPGDNELVFRYYYSKVLAVGDTKVFDDEAAAREQAMKDGCTKIGEIDVGHGVLGACCTE